MEILSATLPIAHAPEIYSLGDIALDLCRILEIAGGYVSKSDAVVLLELAAPELPFMWRTAEAALHSRLTGPTAESKVGTNDVALVEKYCSSGEWFRRERVSVVAEMLQIAVTHVHKERVQLDRLKSYISDLVVK